MYSESYSVPKLYGFIKIGREENKSINSGYTLRLAQIPQCFWNGFNIYFIHFQSKLLDGHLEENKIELSHHEAQGIFIFI